MNTDANAAASPALSPPPNGPRGERARGLPFVCGVGASAGGLEALQALFAEAPLDSNIAWVVVQHLSPDFKSMMVDLLKRVTDLPVSPVEDGAEIQANHVYLIPPAVNLTIFNGRLLLREQQPKAGQHVNLPIDGFFRSLAEDQGSRAVAVVLSGTGSDGSRGVRDIKGHGGLVIVQSPETAKFDGMPRTSIDTGSADLILPPENIARVITQYVEEANGHTILAESEGDQDLRSHVAKIFSLLRSENGVDFSFYKLNTILRRIERRMSIVKAPDILAYLDLLHEQSEERQRLYDDLLIGVTRFFRDPVAWSVFATEVVPEIIARKGDHQVIRCWSAGCSTGEEVYTLAIVLAEAIAQSGRPLDFKIFATDIDQRALDVATRGNYALEAISSDVPPDIRRRYFAQQRSKLSVRRDLRDCIVFARHNVATDIPFPSLDVVVCRNLLIYLQPMLQQRVLSNFHFSLLPDGVLLLGSSETVGELRDDFAPIDQSNRIFKRIGERRALPQSAGMPRFGRGLLTSSNRSASRDTAVDREEEALKRTLLDSVIPPTFLINDSFQILYNYGPTSDWFRLPTGRASLNLLKVVPEPLSLHVSTAVQRALRDRETLRFSTVLAEAQLSFDVEVRPYRTVGAEPLVLVTLRAAPTHEDGLLDEVPGEEEGGQQRSSALLKQRIRDLEQQLQFAQENLQTTIEELETSNEELQATNEELLAGSEELQSTNEELNSVNEELYSVNSEYQQQIKALTAANNDLDNIISNTRIGVIILDNALRIRRYSAAAQSEIPFVVSDLGRPLDNLTHRLSVDLSALAEQVLHELVPLTQDVESASGSWYSVTVQPYRTQNLGVDGIVISLQEITERRALEARVAELEAQLQ
ncbi:MAG: PAS domain-containing protein [Alphaproteobacteria bacterium]|nr:PAS domain-containing protein [Alphaproteobacteria bacterium]